MAQNEELAATDNILSPFFTDNSTDTKLHTTCFTIHLLFLARLSNYCQEKRALTKRDKEIETNGVLEWWGNKWTSQTFLFSWALHTHPYISPQQRSLSQKAHTKKIKLAWLIRAKMGGKEKDRENTNKRGIWSNFSPFVNSEEKAHTHMGIAGYNLCTTLRISFTSWARTRLS